MGGGTISCLYERSLQFGNAASAGINVFVLSAPVARVGKALVHYPRAPNLPMAYPDIMVSVKHGHRSLFRDERKYGDLRIVFTVWIVRL
jgi:hypothetical protein